MYLAIDALVADYTFAKDALFAHINLNGDDLVLYQRLHGALAEKIPRPDLVVYLRAPTPVLLARIARRGRAYERQMEPAYIESLNQAYDDYFSAPDGARERAPVLALDTEHLDFVSNPDDLRHVAEQVQTALGVGAFQAPLPLDGAR